MSSFSGLVSAINLPIVPNRGYCCTRYFNIEAKWLSDIVDKLYQEKNTRDKLLETRINDYKAVIHAANTLEQVEDVWPDAYLIRAELNLEPKMLTTVNDEVISRIKEDADQRKALGLVEAA